MQARFVKLEYVGLGSSEECLGVKHQMGFLGATEFFVQDVRYLVTLFMRSAGQKEPQE